VLGQVAPTEGMTADEVVRVFRALTGPEQVRAVAALLGVPWEAIAPPLAEETFSQPLEEAYEPEDDETLLAAEFGILPLTTMDLPDPLAPALPAEKGVPPVDPQLLQPPHDLLAELFAGDGAPPLSDVETSREAADSDWAARHQGQGNLVDDLFGPGTAHELVEASTGPFDPTDSPTAELPQLAAEANPVHRAELGLPLEPAPDPWDEDEFFSRGRRFR
jgi:hypothetical protein